MGDQFVLVPMQHRYLVGTQKSTDTIRYILEWDMKIDTQGMSYDTGKGDGGLTLEEQRAKIPPFNPPKLNIITDALKIELKDLINEVQMRENIRSNSMVLMISLRMMMRQKILTGVHTNAVSW